MRNEKVGPCTLRDGGGTGIFNAAPGSQVTLAIKELVGRIRIRGAEYPVGTPLLNSPSQEVSFKVLPGRHQLKLDVIFSDLFEGEGELTEKCDGNHCLDKLAPDTLIRFYAICA